MNRSDRWIPYSLILPLFFLAACVKDEGSIKDFAYSNESAWGIPIASARLTANDAIDHFDTEGFTQIAENGQVSIVYADTLDPLQLSDFINFDDQEFEAIFELSDIDFGSLELEDSLAIQDQRLFQFDTGTDDRLDSLRFSGGTFQLEVTSQAGISVGGVISLINPETGELLYSNVVEPSLPPVLINLSGALDNILLTFPSDPPLVNSLLVTYELTLYYNEGVTNQPIDIKLSLIDFGVGSVAGYIAPRSFKLDSEGLNVTMFDDVPESEIRIADPRINFYVSNGFGVSAVLIVDTLLGSPRVGENIVVPGANITPFPTIEAAPAPGQQSTTLLTIDNDRMQNPDVTDFLAAYPNFVNVASTLNVNPNNIDQYAFFSEEAEVGLRYDVEVPIFGSIANLVLEDTTRIGLADLLEDVEDDDWTEVERLDLRLFVENGLPVDASLQLVFLDSLEQSVDQLFSDDLEVILVSAPVNLGVPPDHPDHGRAIGVSNTMLEFAIPRERLLDWRGVTKMVVIVRGHTFGGTDQFIRLFESDAVEAQVSARIKFKADV